MSETRNWQSKYVQLGEVRTHYLEANPSNGQPILLVHGGCPEDCAELTWGLNIAPLSERNRVIAPDLLGFGETEGEDYDLLARTEHVYSLIQNLGLTNLIIVGHSQGAFVSTKIALEHPELVSKLMIVAGGSVTRLGNFDFNENLSIGLRDLIKYVENPSVESLLNRWKGITYDYDIVQRIRPDNYYKESTTKRAFQKYVQAINQYKSNPYLGNQAYERHIEPKLAKNAVRCLVIWGKNDDFSFWWRGADILHKLPNSELLVLDNCKHYVMIDRAIKFNEVLGHFAKS